MLNEVLWRHLLEGDVRTWSARPSLHTTGSEHQPAEEIQHTKKRKAPTFGFSVFRYPMFDVLFFFVLLRCGRGGGQDKQLRKNKPEHSYICALSFQPTNQPPRQHVVWFNGWCGDLSPKHVTRVPCSSPRSDSTSETRSSGQFNSQKQRSAVTFGVPL